MRVVENGQNFILRVPATSKSAIAGLMSYRGLTFSTSASSREEAVLWGTNPYALADLAEPDAPQLGAYRKQIDLSRALDGKGTIKLPPGKELWDYQKATLDYLLARKGGIDGDQPGLGKRQPIDEPVWTPEGWKPIGDLVTGDKVYGADGRTTEVLGIFNEAVAPVYRVTFSDGRSVRCDPEHLWEVERRGGHRYFTEIKTTQEIRDWGLRVKTGNGKQSFRFYVPLVTPVEHPVRDFDIDPYVLGALIGDGALTLDKVALSNPNIDREISERVAERLGQYHLNVNRHPNCPQYHISGPSRTAGSAFHHRIRALGLRVKSPERFIPQDYFLGSISQRLDLLRGLMDTDGNCTNNRTTFCSKSPRLAEDVAQLVRSLGGWAKVRSYKRLNGKDVDFQVNVRLNICPFYLARKAAQWRPTNIKLGIVSIEPEGETMQRCIKVADPRALYVTAGYTLTHNTPTAIAYCNEREAQRVLVIVPASVRLQWAERIKEWSTIPLCKVSTMLKVKDGIHPTANYQIISYDAARNPAIIRAISKYEWDVLICDECLVGDTLIETEIGPIPIRKIVEERLDVRVWSKAPDGSLRLNPIARWVKSSTFELVETRTGDYTLISTKGHRIYAENDTPRLAGEIRSGDSVRVLRRDIFAATSISEEPVLRQKLRNKSPMERTGQNGSCAPEVEGAPDFGRMETIQSRKNYATEFRSRISRQTGRNIEVAERLTFSGRAWRLRKTHPVAPTHSSRIARLVSWLVAGISDIHEICEVGISRFTHALQGRPRQSGVEDRSGNRRCWASLAQGEGSRSAQGPCFEIARVDSISLHQCRGNAAVPVYDLEIERDHNYVANGFLVSNCHKMKNASAITSRAVLGNSRGEYQHGEHKMKAIAGHCREHLALTGTLLLNRPSECWNLFRHFDWEAIDFMSEDQFKERYNRQADMKTIEGKRFKLESTSLELELQNRLRVNIMARHEKKDVLRFMKPPRYSIVKCEENGAVSAALDAEGMLGLSIDEIQTTKDFEILGHIAEVRRLMGVALAPQIADYARDFLEGSDEKLVIFGWHLEVLDIFERELSRFGTVRIDGRKSATARQKAVEDFVERDNVRVFIGNIQAAGTGLDGLQKVCSRCYLAEPDWVPAQNEQAVSRLDRFGQENLVSAEIFVAPGSISEKILVKALEKMNTIYKVLDQKEN